MCIPDQDFIPCHLHLDVLNYFDLWYQTTNFLGEQKYLRKWK